MPTLPWKPWHKVVQLREDLRSGDLALATFAADLYDVMMQRGRRRVYEDPSHFFALTYPTYNLRELAKDVATRLAGKNEKAVRQLELTYGGGKTHTLITLFHLSSDPKNLPDLPAVAEFRQHIGIPLPQARIAALCFDKLDAEKGMEVRGPNGEPRWLKNPWSVLAFQLADSDGLKLLHPNGKDSERESAPAENLLTDLLSLPGKDGRSTLVLVDEVLMYAREKVGLDDAWRSRLVNFFQYLTQAATKVDRCAIVASLLATDPKKSDTLGKELTQELYSIFRREREEGVQPVGKGDVAEILRRRFFTPDSIRDRASFRPHVVAALKGITALDEDTRREGRDAEERFASSFPFHPDLTEVFYGKWTSLEGFQRTRGILRTFALALRESEKWDESPLIGANVFLRPPGEAGLSEAARELTTVAATEEYEGKRQEWTGILEGELGKARSLEQETTGLKGRELEQAVFGTFLHSQPIGQKALTRELLVLAGHTRPDRIELEKAMRRWAVVSWFLDEGAVADAGTGSDGMKQLPKTWRLGSKPNLRQMHHAARERVQPEIVEARLVDDINRMRNLSAGASGAGARVHVLPERPSDIGDDGEFHFAVLGPKAASESGKPSPDARRFLEETTNRDRPRVYRNAVVLAVPSRDGIDAARDAIRDYLAWEEVGSQLRGPDLDPIRAELLRLSTDGARKRIAEAIQQAYCVVVTVSEKNDVQAFKVSPSSEPLFHTVKRDQRSRIQETEISADALLPDGPYDLWRAGEASRRVKDLAGAFAQFPHLPKMLSRQAILDTLIRGCIDGVLVLRLTRPDRTVRTWWREAPNNESLVDSGLEAVLPQQATLGSLPAPLLGPGFLPGLWTGSEISFGNLISYFAGGKAVKVSRGGYEEPCLVPRVERAVLESCIGSAVKDGALWLLAGPASVFREEIPAGLLSDDTVLLAPPSAISPIELLPASLPEAWSGNASTALSVALSLSRRAGKNLPWMLVREALDGAFRSRLLERSLDSGPWPCDFGGASMVKVQVPLESPGETSSSEMPEARAQGFSAEAELSPNELQDLADIVGELGKVAAGQSLRYVVRIELGSGPKTPAGIVEKLNGMLGPISKKLRF
ncbi:MAG: hypothetical protein DIJKHBIC_00155 [Thermoanaerobaculia bacterium]|nr:hypothetical protein [Thermoanaerobaculia bacterium]